MTRSSSKTRQILAFIFFPGTLIHELSHALMAGILLVPVHDIHLLPKLTEDGVILGSVEFEKTDPIRRSLIGIAPMIGGILVIGLVVWFGRQNTILNLDLIWQIGLLLLTFYLIFTVSNTLYSSKKDLEGVWIIVLIACVVFVLMIMNKTNNWGLFSWLPYQFINQHILQACLVLTVSLLVNLFVSTVLSWVLRRHKY